MQAKQGKAILSYAKQRKSLQSNAKIVCFSAEVLCNNVTLSMRFSSGVPVFSEGIRPLFIYRSYLCLHICVLRIRLLIVLVIIFVFFPWFGAARRLCEFVCYGADGEGVYALVQCVNHEQDQQQQQFSTPADKISLVKRIQGRVPGGEATWDNTLAKILQVLGKNKKKAVSNWILLTKCLPEEVQQYIKTDKKTSAAHLSNKFLTGMCDGREEKKYKLSSESAVKALILLDAERQSNARISSSEFETKICLTLKQVAMHNIM